MTDVATSRPQFLELPIPSIPVRRDGRPCAPPIRVPELTTDAITGTLAHGVLDGRSPDERQVGWNTSNVLPGPELDVLRLERMELESQIPDLRRECVELRGKLAGLKREIRAAQEDRDVLFAAAAAHRKYVAELSREQPEQDQEELLALRRELQVLRKRNSELEGPRVRFGIPTKIFQLPSWNGRQRFDDS